jgi:6-phosphogluconolactonase
VIQVFDDGEAASRGAADQFVRQACRAAEERGNCTVALAGGQTPRRTYELLAEPPRLHMIPWRKTEWFWGDERCVAAADERSNARMVRQAMLDRLDVDVFKVHPIRCVSDPVQAAARYDELLRQRFSAADTSFDLVFLGLGHDGHTASLFPYSQVLAQTDRFAAGVSASGKGVARVTLTPLLLNRARLVLFLVLGRDKAQILREVLEGETDTRRLPAQLIMPTKGRLIWLMDREAASLLGEHSLAAKAG